MVITAFQVNGLDSVLSRADMWALMAIWAVNRTISLNNDDCASCAQSPDLSTEFLWGRVGYNSVLQSQRG